MEVYLFISFWLMMLAGLMAFHTVSTYSIFRMKIDHGISAYSAGFGLYTGKVFSEGLGMDKK